MSKGVLNFLVGLSEGAHASSDAEEGTVQNTEALHL